MNDFMLFFKWGWDHIVSKEALDHILFILAITIVFSIQEWKKLLVMITAFTIGHSLTLALSVLDIFRLPSDLVEAMIPCTIAIATVVNVWTPKGIETQRQLNYLVILFFGLIHGMGFANAIRFALIEGQSLGWSLLGFNIGLECGQIFVVLIILLTAWALTRWTPIQKDKIIWGVSIFVFIVALLMVIERI